MPHLYYPQTAAQAKNDLFLFSRGTNIVPAGDPAPSILPPKDGRATARLQDIRSSFVPRNKSLPPAATPPRPPISDIVLGAPHTVPVSFRRTVPVAFRERGVFVHLATNTVAPPEPTSFATPSPAAVAEDFASEGELDQGWYWLNDGDQATTRWKASSIK